MKHEALVAAHSSQDRALHERLAEAVGLTRCIMMVGTLEGHVSVREPGSLYVLDTRSGLLFVEPMVPISGLFGTPWTPPDEKRLQERQVRLMCGLDDPLTLEDAFERIGEIAEQLAAPLSADSEWFDLSQPCSAISLSEVPEGALIVKHPAKPVFVVGPRAGTVQGGTCNE